MTNHSELEEERRIINAGYPSDHLSVDVTNQPRSADIEAQEMNGHIVIQDWTLFHEVDPKIAHRIVHSWNTLPLRNAQVEAALKWAEKHAARACGESLRRAIEEAGA